MSWCGGGEMSGVPGSVCRIVAMYGDTLCPGSWPPSPGFEPCAILISSSHAAARYGGVTPNRPDATCLMRLLASSLLRFCHHRHASSPPSPVLLFPPMRFIPMAMVSCASGLSAPSDMAPVANRRMIDSTGSTSSIGIGGRSLLKSSRSRRAMGSRLFTMSA